MHGPDILTRFLETPGKPDKYGNAWQYHPRSDRHSKVGCWGVAFDLLRTSALLREHAARGKVVLGINHTMVDHATSRKKDIDLVIARPGTVGVKGAGSLRSLVARYGIPLTSGEAQELQALPDIEVGDVGAVLIALEAKAAMTEHIKALPRLYDELNSSHLTIHGASTQALAIAYVQINAATAFVSPTRHPFSLAQTVWEVTAHDQPRAVQRVLQKVKELPRRSSTRDTGFDGVGITILELQNTGGPVSLITGPPAPQPGDQFEYGTMIVRMANEYDATFSRI